MSCHNHPKCTKKCNLGVNKSLLYNKFLSTSSKVGSVPYLLADALPGDHGLGGVVGAEMPVVVVALCRICNRGGEPTLQHTDICVFISNRQNCGCEKYSRKLGILQGTAQRGGQKSDRGTDAADADAMRCLPVSE